MHTSPNELRPRLLRYFSYILIGLFVAGGTFYLTNYARGILINPRTGDVVETGLVVIQSTPVSGSIKINGSDIEESTPNRQVLPTGSYSIELSADKYRTWSKDFMITGTELIWLDYPLLIPQEINTANVVDLNEKPIFAASNNRRWLLTSQSSGSFELSRIDQETTTSEALNLTDSLMESLGKDSKLLNLTFSSDDRYILAEYAVGKGIKFVRIDRQNSEESILIDEEIDTGFDELTFDSDRNINNLYGIKGKRLYQINLADLEVTEIAHSVEAFYSYQDYVFTIQTPDEKYDQASVSYIQDGGDEKVIGEIPSSKSYEISARKFDNILSVAASNKSDVYIFKNVENILKPKPKISKTRAKTMEFTSNGRFVMITDGKDVEVFDQEINRRFDFEFSKQATRVVWLDNFRLVGTVDSQVKLVDFDGYNQHNIVKASTAVAPIANRDNESIFSISGAKDNYVLQRSKLRVD